MSNNKFSPLDENEYSKFFSVSLDMLCISSFDGHFKKVNPAFEEVLGFSAEELCSKSYLDFIHPDDIERTKAEVQKQLTTGQNVLSFENRYRCKDGSFKWLSWKSVPIGELMYAAARDITENRRFEDEMKRARESIESSNRELEAFSYSVAHDLRAPIRSIIGFSTMILEKGDPMTEESKELLNRVVASGRKLGSLIDALLDLSRVSRRDISRTSVDLSDLAREILEDYRKLSPLRPAEFLVAPNLVVQGDPTLLRVALTNLIDNAWKYSSKLKVSAKIEFGTTNKENKLIYFVRDNGAGFDMSTASKLFGVFQRFHSTKEYEGTGVGLATVQRIIRRHGGEIWVEAAEGQGATFFFTLT